MLIPRKRCPKCSAVFEGEAVQNTFSCDVCGNGYLCPLEPVQSKKSDTAPLPRSGGAARFHTRENY